MQSSDENQSDDDAHQGVISSHSLNRASMGSSWSADNTDQSSDESRRKSTNEIERISLSRNSQSNEASFDSAELAIHRVADARDGVQKKTFTKWVNQHLAKINRSVDDLYEDLRDGLGLIALLEALSGTTLPREENYIKRMRLPREKGRMRFHRLQNVQIALDFLRQRKLRLVNIRSDDITDGNPKLTLGLIWTIILHFQIEDISLDGVEDLSARQALLLWAQRNMEGYDGIRVTNFSSSWQDGKAFNVIIHRNKPELIDINQVYSNDNRTNLDQAFSIAEKECGVTRLLDSEDIDVDHPDERSIITYLSSLYDTFPQVPPFPIKVTEEEWKFAWEEYRLMITTLLEWIKEQTTIMDSTKDIECAESVAEINTLKIELRKFQTEDIPSKEDDLKSAFPKYQNIKELSAESRGKYQPPPGYEPSKLTEPWRDLLNAVTRRGMLIDSKFEQLSLCSDLLAKFNAAASECHKRLESAEKGIDEMRNGNNDASMSKDVLENIESSESILKSMNADIQALKDRQFPKTDDLQKTLLTLQEKYDAVKAKYEEALQLAKQRQFVNSEEYSFLQQCIQWVDDKQAIVELFAFGNDLPGTKHQIEKFGVLQDEVLGFDSTVQKCQHENKDKFDVSTPEYTTYSELLVVLEKKYVSLKKSVEDRRSLLEDLLLFVREATEHLMWMQQKEDAILPIKISSSEAAEMTKECEVFVGEIKIQEPPISATLEKAVALQNHPAFSVVQTYVTALTTQQEFLGVIAICLKQHQKDLAQQEQFDIACNDAKEKLDVFNKQVDDIDESVVTSEGDSESDIAEKLTKLEADLVDFRKVIEDLLEQSTKVPCIKERNIPVSPEDAFPLTSLCNYSGKHVNVAESEECKLVSNDEDSLWKIKTFSDQEGTAPALLFRMPPISKLNVEKAKLQEARLNDLLNQSNQTVAKWRFCKACVKCQNDCDSVLALDLDKYKAMSPDERERALQELKEDAASLSESLENVEWDRAEDRHASCTTSLDRCYKHMEDLERQVMEENEIQNKCESYTLQLNDILRQLKDIHQFLTVAIITPLPQTQQELPSIVKNHKATMKELSQLQPQYEKLSSEVSEFIEKYPAHSTVSSVSSVLNDVVSHWKTNSTLTHLYLERLNCACIMVDKLDLVEEVITELEERITTVEIDGVDSVEEILAKQKVVEDVQTTLNFKSSLLDDMKDQGSKLQDTSNPIDEYMSSDSNTQACLDDMNLFAVSTDSDAWLERITTTVERWEALIRLLNERLQSLASLLPEAERAAAEKQKAEDLLDKLRAMLEKILQLEKQQTSLVSNELPFDLQELQESLDNQENTVREIENLKEDYINTQSDVVNFINNEVNKEAEYLPQLKDDLHRLQESWTNLWLICHVQLEKIKGLLHLLRALNDCEKLIDDFEDKLSNCDAGEEDIERLKLRADNLEILKNSCETVDKNFVIIKANLATTQNVSTQFPNDLTTGEELVTSDAKISALEERWDAIKKRLEKMSEDVSNKLETLLNKAAAEKQKAENLLDKLRTMLEKILQLEKQQTSLVSNELPFDLQELQESLDNQENTVREIENLKEDYINTQSDVVNFINNEVNKEAEYLPQLKDDLHRLQESWTNLWLICHVQLEKIKGLLHLLRALNDCEKLIDDFEDKLSNCDAGEEDIERLKLRADNLEILKNSCETVDKNFVIIKANLATTQNVSTQFPNDLTTGEELVTSDAKISALEERWDAIKKRLEKMSEDVSNKLETLLNKAAAEKQKAENLLDRLRTMLEKILQLEKQQTSLVSNELPFDLQELQESQDNQENTVREIENLKEDYINTQSDVVNFINNEVNKEAEYLPQLKDDLHRLQESWTNLWLICHVQLEKIKGLLHLLRALNDCEKLIDDFEDKLSNCDAGEEDIERLKLRADNLEILKNSCETVDKNFVIIKANLATTQNVSTQFPNDLTTGEELVTSDAKISALEERWNAIKKRLEKMSEEVSNKLETLNKEAAMREEASRNLLEKLKNLRKEVDVIEQKVLDQSNMQLPVDVKSIENAENEFDALKPKLMETKSGADDLYKEFENIKTSEIPEKKQIEDEFVEFFEKWQFVNSLFDQRMQIFKKMVETAQSVEETDEIVSAYAQQLLLHDTMSEKQEGLEQQREILQKLDSDIPVNQPKFEELKERSESLEECLRSTEQHGVSYDDTFPATARGILEKWDDAKKQVKERLPCVETGQDKLAEFERSVEEHKAALQEKETLLNAQNAEEEPLESKALQEKIDELEKLEEDLSSLHYSAMERIEDLSREFDDDARKHDQVAFEYEPPKNEKLPEKEKLTLEELEDRNNERKNAVEHEIPELAERFDKLRKLIADMIEKCKADYEEAKEREDKELENAQKQRNLEDIKFETYLERQTSARELHKAGIVSDDMARRLEMGTLHEDEIEHEFRSYLKGTEPISGLIIEKAENLKMSISDAIEHRLIKSGTGLVLLEAQAATGNVINPITGQHMSVADAIESGLINKRHRDALDRAERAVTGFEDPVTHKCLSLYECMKKGYIVESHGIRLLEAQIATGGLIDPRAYHRVPISVAYKRGLFDERMNAILEDPSDDTKGFFDPNTQKNLTYLELVQKCQEDPDSGLLFLGLSLSDSEVERLMERLSKACNAKKRNQDDIKFNTAFHHEAKLQDIFEAGLVTEEQVMDLESGILTESDLQAQLKQYLFGGEEPISGVVLEDSGEILTVVEAVEKGLLRRGTAVELLEAQAAVGNITDPKTGVKMSVKTAYDKGLIEKSHIDTLERAERAVKGYRVPGTNQILSLFEAMRKGMVVESRGIRLLEAQIATGGLIDPRAHHRVPISVAYKRGLFDERMNDILEDPSDDTKGFFDPNTQKNLSYLDLMEKCEIKEPSKVRLLVVKLKSKRSSKKHKSKSKKDAKVKKPKSKEEKPEVSIRQLTRHEIKFPALFHKEVSLDDLVNIEIVKEEEAVAVEQGNMRKEELEKSIVQYLRGSACVSGVLISGTGEALSFLEATSRGLITSEIAMQYLEAQAYNGIITNPKTGEEMCVLDAYMSGLIKRNQMKRLQDAEELVLGRFESGKIVRLNLRELLEKDAISASQLICVVQCQIAAGGIIDIQNNLHLPLEIAIKQGFVEDDIIKKAADAKIFVDPFTKEQKTYAEVLSSCEINSDNGVCLLPCTLQSNEAATELDGSPNKLKSRNDIKFPTTLNRFASLVDLLQAGIVSEETVLALEENRLSEDDVAHSIRQFLVGEHPIAGILEDATGQKFSILECIQKGILKRGTGLELLEAQAANGSIIEPRTGQHFDVPAAMNHQLIDRTQTDALERALKAVTGYKDPLSKATISLFQAMEKGYVTKSRGIRLLEAQIATGGLIDPEASHRVPLSVAYNRNIISKTMYGILTDPSDDTKDEELASAVAVDGAPYMNGFRDFSQPAADSLIKHETKNSTDALQQLKSHLSKVSIKLADILNVNTVANVDIQEIRNTLDCLSVALIELETNEHLLSTLRDCMLESTNEKEGGSCDDDISKLTDKLSSCEVDDLLQNNPDVKNALLSSTNGLDAHDAKLSELLQAVIQVNSLCKELQGWITTSSTYCNSDITTNTLVLEKTLAAMEKLKDLQTVAEELKLREEKLHPVLSFIAETCVHSDFLLNKTDIISRFSSLLEDLEKTNLELNARHNELEKFYELRSKLQAQLDIAENRVTEYEHSKSESDEECSNLNDLQHKRNQAKLIRKPSAHLIPLPSWHSNEQLQNILEKDLQRFLKIEEAVGISQKQLAPDEYWNMFVQNLTDCTKHLHDIEEKMELFQKIGSLESEALLLKQEEEENLRELLANALLQSDCILMQADYLIHQLVQCHPNEIKDLLEKWQFAFSNVVVGKEERMNKTCLIVSLALKWHESHEELLHFIHDMNMDAASQFTDVSGKPGLKSQMEATQKICLKLTDYKVLVDKLNNIKTDLQSMIGPSFVDVAENIINLTDKASRDYDQTVEMWQDTLATLETANVLYILFHDEYENFMKKLTAVRNDLDNLGSLLLEQEHVNQRIQLIEKMADEGFLQENYRKIEQTADELKPLLISLECDEFLREISQKMKDLSEEFSQLQTFINEHLVRTKEGSSCLENFNTLSESAIARLNDVMEAVISCNPSLDGIEDVEDVLQTLEPLIKDVNEAELLVNNVRDAFDKCKELNSPSGYDLSCVKLIVENVEGLWDKIKSLLEKKKRSLAQEVAKRNEEKLESIHKQNELLKAELARLEQWVEEKHRDLNSSALYGGLPETAQEQLNQHVAFMGELCEKRGELKQLLADHDLEDNEIKEKFDSLAHDSEIRKAKLEETLNDATVFHEQLQYFMEWLGRSEKTLDGQNKTAVNVLNDQIIQQVTVHQAFEESVQSHRLKLLDLDKMGSRLKYFSQKQDGILIKNLLLSVHARWDKLLAGVSSRSLLLTDIFKKSKQFYDGITDLREWIRSAVIQLDSNQPLYDADPVYAKSRIKAHEEFQRALSSKKPVYDAVLRSGAILHGKATLEHEKSKIDIDLQNLKHDWDALKHKSQRRQKELEDALIFSIQFRDSLEAILQWLYKIEPQLSVDGKVHGEIHIVESLVRKHEILKKELRDYHPNVIALQQALRHEQGDCWVNNQMQELLNRWNVVTTLIDEKQTKLNAAQSEAKELHVSTQTLLHELSAIESSLHFHQPLSQDEFQLQEAKVLYQDTLSEFNGKAAELERILNLANSVLEKAHPDSVIPIRQLIKVLQAKWNEVLARSTNYSAQLDEAIQEVEKNNLLIEKLKNWLDSAENALKQKRRQPIIPENIESLSSELQTFQDEMVALQPDYDKLMSLHSARKFQPATMKQGGLKPKIVHTDENGSSAMKDQCEALHKQWKRVWLSALERQRELQEANDDAHKKELLGGKMFETWRKRYMKWMKHKKSKVMDLFRAIDKDADGKITRQEFMHAILNSKFSTSESEMSKIADMFDQDHDGTIDYYKFVSALYPQSDSYKPESDADKIENEVVRQVANCTCCKRFRVQQIAENKYRFGDNQQLRLVRILKSTVMVRVGGGWMALDEFLIKNDPCRAKRRTNTELRESLVSPAGSSHSMTAFRTKRASRIK